MTHMKAIRYETFKDRVLSAGYRTAVLQLTRNGKAFDESLASLVARHNKMSSAYQNRNEKFNPAEEFARESANISGLGPAHTGKRVQETWREIQSKRRRRKPKFELVKTEMVYIDRLFERHVELAQTCLNWQAPSRMAHPITINMPLCGDVETAHWRSGVRAGMWDRLPNPDSVRVLINDNWLPFIEATIAAFSSADEDTKTTIAWALHDFYICVEPFDKANGRSARLLLQIVRIRLGLGAIVVRHNNMLFHESRFKLFRDRVFVPMMKEHAYLV